MNSWEDEAKFVLKELREDDELLFRDDKDHSARAENDAFVRKWGFSYNDMWDLDKAIAMFILPRVAYYRAHNEWVPGILIKDVDDENEAALQEAAQEWDRILQTICDGFHLYLEKSMMFFTKEEKALWEDAKQYLFEYIECLGR